MNKKPVFISHSTKDDDFVRELRLALEGQGLTVWADSRELIGGAKLVPGIEQAIEGARQFLVVLSRNSIDVCRMTSNPLKSLTPGR